VEPDGAPTAWLKPIASIRLIDPRAGVGEAWLKLCTVSDVAYLRRAMHDWMDWAQRHTVPQPLFNWVSIRNFHPSEDALVYSLDSAGQMISLGNPAFGVGTTAFGGMGTEP
jgi:hypothetical protein